MNVRLVLFAGLRQARRLQERHRLPARIPPPSATCSTAGVPDLLLHRTFYVAVNEEFAQRDTVLHDGDEVALLPPVSGGFFPPHS